jgi:cell division septum initiation protein DivIVA
VAGDANDNSKDLLEFIGAADRAGSIVTDQVRSIIEAAEARAAEIRRQAEEDARRTREAASQVAQSVLDRIDAMGGPLSELVSELRSESERLAARAERGSAD